MAPENNYSPFSGPKSKALSYRVTTVEKPADFLKFLAEDDRLCVVKVHAKWCVICKKFDAKWRNYVRVEGDKYDFEGNLSVRGRIRFAEIEFTVNEDLDLFRHFTALKDPAHLGMLDEIPGHPLEQTHSTLIGLLHEPRESLGRL